MSESLKIIKGGKLSETKWVYDREAKEGSYVITDVTDQAIRKLFDSCELEEGVTLKDIFLLLNTELEIFDAVIGNWCKEIVEEGLNKPSKEYTGTYDPQGIEYLELYWDFWADQGSKYGPKFYGYSRADIHGIGFELQDNTYFDWKDKDGNPAIEYHKGHRINWSLSFQASNDLINLPVKLQSEVPIYNDDVDDKENWHKVMMTFKGADFTLGHILYSIIWELSFHGGPDSRAEAKADLDTAVKELDAGIAKTVPYKSIMDEEE